MELSFQFFWAIEDQPYDGTPISAPYWDFTINSVIFTDENGWQTKYYVFISEMVMETSTGSGQLAIGGTVSAAPTYDGSPDNVFDGDPDTFWESDFNNLDGGQWIGYEFPAPVSVGSITVTCGVFDYPEERPTRGTMDYSFDGEEWFTGWPVVLPFTNNGTVAETFTATGSIAAPIVVGFNTRWMLGDFDTEVTVDFDTAWDLNAPPVDTSRFIIPDIPVTELWTFQTSIFRSRNGREERRARVVRPVISVQYAAPSFDPADFWATRRTLEIDTNEFYPVPLYQYFAYLDEPAHIGDKRLYFSQVRTNVVAQQYIAVIKDGVEPIIYRVQEVHDDGVTLMFPIEIELDTLFMICPVIMSRLGADASTQHSMVHAYTTFSFVSAQRELAFIRPGASVALPMLDDLPLLAQYIRANDAINETLVSGNTVIDNARANPIMFVNEGTRRQFDLVYKIARQGRPQDMDFWRGFFGYIRGAQKAFALPTFRPDGELNAAVAGGETEITITGPDFHDVWARGGYAGVALGQGTALVIEPCRVLSVEIVNGHSVCQLAAPIVGSDYDTVSFIMSVRCASDQVTLEHHEDETFISFSVISVRV